ncbi:probable ATP synthase 24 kDa subunit, mitochondrial [Cucurbita moschata]|uniref:Probable ATP synthase 24 kDa subunit, mitochondrial n=1 Tax=Cucurbita moschata TaxID=3662 RepID=A0A6J1HFN0_CUCMO|nr:probable ATP synthase 24 kDa subunit, mitochondrial [Cucurbita moschata]
MRSRLHRTISSRAPPPLRADCLLHTPNISDFQSSNDSTKHQKKGAIRATIMAFSSRLLSKSKQVLGGRSILHQGYAIPVRHFAEEAPRPALKGDETLKNIFLEVKKKFDTAIDVFRKEKITIDPEDPAAVAQYAKVMKQAREKADLFSESEVIKNTIQSRTQGIPDARTYLLTLKDIRIERGLNDQLGAEAMMFDALEKIEKELKKPLMRNDKKGMSLLMAEFDKINQKIGIRREDLPKYEEQLELKISKAQLEDLKKDALEAMETQKKREEFKDEEMVDTKSLDVRNFL